ncbi:MAG: tetratricopeptide repeat protein [Gemmataceae bacterium]|nr:tetratricopeptide repeat protein [Gemmataceae bacterium]
MRSLVYLVFLTAAFAPPHSAAGQPPAKPDDPLKAARQRLLRGNYAEAREAFAALGQNPQAAIGIAAAWRAEGEAGKALDALDAGLKASPGHPDLLAHRADLFLSLGKWDDARKDAEAALAKQDKHFLARWVRAQLLRESGDLPKADAEVRWLVREYTDASNADKDITDPDLLLIVGQAGAENAAWNNRPQQFSFILNEVYRDALKHDPDCWQAEYLAGRMLLDKHNRADALNAFDAALKINPRAADALVGKGLVALDGLDLAEAERFAEQALKVNPRHPGALRLKADVLVAGADLPAAERLLTAARLVNPRDEATLARLAAVYHLMGKPAEVAALAKGVESFDAKPARFYHDLAAVLDDRQQYPKAEEYYRRAADLRPNVPGPRGALGLLLMRTGREAEARPALEAARKADPFDVRVLNSLRVLKYLEGYQTVETPHYVVRFDPKADALLAPFLADYLEEVHAEFKRRYGYEPDGKVLVEVFGSREMFGGRTIALPRLPDAVAGACSGRVISFPSPAARKGDPANWARVVRHELTHAFNLLQTDHRVPHWLTEGLAVRAEGQGRPPQWVAVLRRRAAAGALLDLDTITLAFARPRAADDWPLAYFQALLYVEYAVTAHGEAAVGRLLDAYRTTTDTAAALKAALGVEKAEFERGYRKYVEGVLKASGRRAEKPLTFAELEAAYKATPDDPDLMARLAAQYARRGKVPEAKKLADDALAKEKGHPGAAVVKARLLDRGKDPAAARAVLEEAAKENPDDPRVLLALGRQLITAKELEAAAAAFERGRKAAPDDADWLSELARLYNTLDRPAELAGVLAELAARDPDDRPVRVKLARLLLARDPAGAERVAWEALRLDLRDPQARAALLDVLKARGKDAEAARVAGRYE